MGKTFKDLSFMKKVGAVFLIGVLAIALCVFGLLGIMFVGEMNGTSNFGSMTAKDAEELAGDYYTSSSNSFSDSSESSSVSVSGVDANREILAKDVSLDIESKHIMDTVDSVVELSRNYSAVYNGSYVSDNGYGYADFEVPTDKVDDFVATVRDQYDVTSYRNDISNVADSYDNIDDRIAYLEEDIKMLENQIKEARENEEDVSYFESEIRYDKEELWNLQNSRSNLDNEVAYSNVYIYVKDSSYTEFHTFDGVWLALKTGMHVFVLGLIYGLYFLAYVFVLIFVVKCMRRFFKYLGSKNFIKHEKSMNIAENVEPVQVVENDEEDK